MSWTNIPPSSSTGGGLTGSWLQKYYLLGRTRTGLTDDQIGYYYEDFQDTLRWTFVAVSPTIVTSLPGGVIQLSSGAGGAAIDSYTGNGTGYHTMAKLNKWAIAFRYRYTAPTNPPPAGQYAGAGFRVQNTANFFFCGMHSTVSTTKFAARWTSDGVSFGNHSHSTNLDNAWHTISAAFNGTTLTMDVDGVVDTTTTDVNRLSSSPAQGWLTGSPSGTQAITMQFDKLFTMFEQAA